MNVAKLNPSARRYASALVKRFPRFRKNCTVEKDGDFEAFIWAPPASNAGALICQSFLGDVWVRFAPGQTGCCVESVEEMLKVVRDLMSSKLVISVVSTKKSWVETTLRRSGTKPALKRGQTAAIYSWFSRSGPRSNRAKRSCQTKVKKRSKSGGAA
jgi:hypothetical protein